MKKSLLLALTLPLLTGTLYAAEIDSTNTQAAVTYNANVATSLDNIADKLREFQEKNPNASDAELNEYADSLLKTEVSTTPTRASRSITTYSTSSVYTDMDGYVSGYLNPQEQALYNSNRAKALLCIANGKSALEYSKEKYVNSVLHNGNGDAFRHTLWTFGMTIDVGADFAKKWSDAHEYGSTGQPALERSMDLYNNSIGISLGKNNPTTALRSTFINLTQQQVRSGRLKVISNGGLVWSSSAGEK
ncbi:hypothetical protein HCY58_11725 [Acinetobacter radioresistens]|uniref:DUF6973 domain-containing protein n=1 Tax=Acinetobacter radioresistens TaxID=40216 RepID=UPI002005A3EE|nr:hypothetical protein [Acinetobacter radioresistens]MCK4087715.1 hypothetical protein [Acinetobacter radioresistens]MCK4093500.1 hypothetical protein [Acinetobacter radioresistens]